MTRLLTAAVLLALVVSGAALAAAGDHGEAQKRIVKADQARAKAMLLRRTDLPAGFKATRPAPDSGHYYCKALDESDLTITGEAESQDFDAQLVFASSGAMLYETLADAEASWRRSTSTAGVACARNLLTREFRKQGLVVRAVRKIAFPKVSPGRTLAYRLEVRAHDVPVLFDVIGLEHGRAHVNLLVGSALQPFPKPEAVRLARLLAGRTARAMRGT